MEKSRFRNVTDKGIIDYDENGNPIHEVYINGTRWAATETGRHYNDDGKLVIERTIQPYEHYSFEKYMDCLDDVDHDRESYYAMIDGDENEYPDYYPGAFDDYFR